MSEETLQQGSAGKARRAGRKREIPQPALVFGWLWLVPLFGLPIAAFFVSAQAAAFLLNAQLIWAAIGLGFLGAVHWGFQLQRKQEEVESDQGVITLGLAALPGLVGFLAVLIGNVTGFALFLVAFPTLGLGDELATHHNMAPGWYPRYRAPLTWMTLLGLLVGVAALFTVAL